MKTFYAPGKVMEFTAPAGGVTAGTGVKIGSLLVIALVTAAENVKFNGVAEGIVEVAKVSTEEWTEGQQVNWDDSAKNFTEVTTGKYKAGIAAKAAANPSATGYVRLNGVDLGAALA